MAEEINGPATEEAESKSSSAIVPTVFRPEDYLTVSFMNHSYTCI